ncbi:Splicing factor YJU2 [Frankliniella fusca]|uniref:Splicing factor YJU2 n=1 Tax=Frankliniella fusca TaxID=407009 RepID=A0AAE1LIE4_9NEOP|nr:Splicing factor YJU2 [Frankliniella fusca]
MSERKVLNKYYPPDFDPSKIPRMKLPKNRQYTVRLMAPCNMRCKTCGEYIYKGKKFNARKEDVEGEDYLGIRIYRFYIKCTRCLQEISFKTDPKNTDYEIEAGATRNFMALKLAEEQAQREEDERKEEEATNPMKLLENRTQQSKQELELLESLEELKDLNRRQQSIDYDTMLSKYNDKEALERLKKKQEEEDEEMVKSIYGTSIKGKRVLEEEIIEDIDSMEETQSSTEPPKKQIRSFTTGPSSSVTPAAKLRTNVSSKPSQASWNKSVGLLKNGSGLAGLVRKKGSGATSSESISASDVKPDNSQQSSSDTTATLPAKIPPVSSGLSLLGSYSDSDSETGSDN